SFIADTAAIAGPVTLRLAGLAIAGILEAVVFVGVYRHPTPRALALGVAASSLVAFTALTKLHERYAFGALVFLALWLPERRVRVRDNAAGRGLRQRPVAVSGRRRRRLLRSERRCAAQRQHGLRRRSRLLLRPAMGRRVRGAVLAGARGDPRGHPRPRRRRAV